MAERVLFIGWGETVHGREERGLEVFNDALGLYGRMQQQGKIESFNTVLLDPSGGKLEGYIELRGSAQQLAAARQDEEFRRVMVDAALVVHDLRIVDGACDKGVEKEIGIYQQALAKVPQMA
jgi:hypothetical protein